MEFDDNDRLARLTGEHNQNLARLETALDVSLDSFGNSITISGPGSAMKTAQRALEDIYRQLGEREGRRCVLDRLYQIPISCPSDAHLR